MKIIGVKKSAPVGAHKEAFSHIARFSYRKGFPPIGSSGLTSDSGWGCCYRTSQAVVAQFVFRLNEEFPSIYADKFGESTHRLSLFDDVPTAVFGLHRLVLESEKLGLAVGKWAKPTSIAKAIHVVCGQLQIGCIVSEGFSISRGQMECPFPALLLIPGLFGLGKFDLAYLPFLQLCLCAENSLGFVTGKRNSSYYIAGFDSKHFAYFDPHTRQHAVVSSDGFPSYYSLNPCLISFADINPSILLAFFVRTPEDLLDLTRVLTACHSSPIALTDDFDEADCEKVLDIDDLRDGED
jgi:cysteine protease ATG4